jgi:carbon storage regulator
MLIMTRNVKQSLKIGPDITVAVIGVNGKQVRIGIDAPKEIAVLREEVAKRIKSADQQLVLRGPNVSKAKHKWNSAGNNAASDRNPDA